MENIDITIIVIIVFIFNLITVPLILFLLYKKIFKPALVQIQPIENLSPEGLQIPIIGAYTGIKDIPYWAIARNTFNPFLKIFPDKIEYRVILKHKKNLDQIESIDCYELIGIKNIRFNFADSPFSFSANLLNVENLKKVLQYFKNNGIKLSDKAEKYLNKPQLS
ncbi:hypothetical protein A2526_04895 [candidate division WOR-1 bacterium RIFOXYD2_FULL_36_8]|uniref:Uncharacterized protein n=3 Tax=Bacteria TaxID=2 RepID=A0A1F4S4I1_UNCSA|nr:MAG: hypothetical protein A2230_04445 [candidate division WOR-1 bacterium RIFOXYA2_FULL_36_21]OGC14643.1 MAG: hypothetical protein A2290_01175 [candidate division WOR-1 bacterium RIFOXYB2_FULL_36_35]OGC19661.1 MAG: hypothetical protein A2282_02900 [candidate division WOR-1 bacterium RIFOXYA12_FULL_36_13]OGC41377.1 MAG: hypothetical protein A2526_04895 [candidate division WOR-1 bacterium RIFOXYD2_FULL_36_8]